MKIYFDTEFTGLHKNTTLISIGLVSEDGREFYAQLTDYDPAHIDDWIQENVMNNLLDNDEIEENCYVVGTKEEVKGELTKWFSQFDEIQFVADVGHYDFVLLIDIFGTAFDMPKNCSPAYHDFNSDLARYYGKTELAVFDYPREQLLGKFGVNIEGRKHNALYDAKVTKALSENINNTNDSEK